MIKHVGYHLVRNGTSTAGKAPYLGVAVPSGSLAYGNDYLRLGGFPPTHAELPVSSGR